MKDKVAGLETEITNLLAHNDDLKLHVEALKNNIENKVKIISYLNMRNGMDKEKTRLIVAQNRLKEGVESILGTELLQKKQKASFQRLIDEYYNTISQEVLIETKRDYSTKGKRSHIPGKNENRGNI